MNPETSEHLDLIDGLRNWADGFSADRAAVELLIEHGSWLTRSDFIDQCVDIVPDDELVDPDRPVSIIDWENVFAALNDGELPASGSAVGMLRIAASLGAGYPVDLRDALVGLDNTNAAAVVDAVITTTQSGDAVLATRSPGAPRQVID